MANKILSKKENNTHVKKNTEKEINDRTKEEVSDKSPKKKANKLSEQENKDRNELIDYIYALFGIDTTVTIKNLYKTIKDYVEDLNYTYKGIQDTLIFYYKVLNNPVPDKVSIGIVPYYYKKAQDYYKEKPDMRALFDYINKLFGQKNNEIDPLIYSSIMKYHNQMNCSFQGMKTTLDYYYHILGNVIPDKPTVWCIPYYYNEAKDFYINKKNIKQEGTPQIIPVINVFVSEKNRQNFQREFEERWRNPKNKISISEIEVDEDEIFEDV